MNLTSKTKSIEEMDENIIAILIEKYESKQDYTPKWKDMSLCIT